MVFSMYELMDSLNQGVHQGLLVARGQQLLLLICTGQGIAAVVSSHVQSSIHRIREVGRLQKKKMDIHEIRPIL